MFSLLGLVRGAAQGALLTRGSYVKSHIAVRSLAATGTAAALGLGGVLVAATPADAASLTTSYTCGTLVGDKTFAVTIRLRLPASVVTGSRVKARPVHATLTLPADVVAGLRFIGVTEISGTATKMFYRVGKKSVGMKNVKLAKTPVPASGPMPIKADGTAKAFIAPAPGRYAIKVPKSFLFNGVDQNGEPLPGSPISCSLASGAPAKIGTLRVTRH